MGRCGETHPDCGGAQLYVLLCEGGDRRFRRETLIRGGLQDCTATLIMLFTELDERIAESTRNDVIPKDNATRSKGRSLEAMQVTPETGAAKVKSDDYKT